MIDEKKEQNKKTFEEALNELKDVVETLENKDVPLEKAIILFEKGITLSKYCEKLLDEAEQKIKILLSDKNSGEEIIEDFSGSY